MNGLWQDVVYGFRTLLKRPGFTAVAALSLALGIAANTVIFSLINTTLLRPLPFRDAGRLMAIWTVPQQRPDQRNSSNVSAYLAWREQSRSFESMGAFFGIDRSIGAEENGAPAERIGGQFFTPSLFETLGVKPALGRVFTEEEGKPEANAPVVIISDGLWLRRFNRDPNILGRTILLEEVTTTIIGVMPPQFSLFQDDAEYWGPSGFGRERVQSAAGLVLVVGRLRSGVSMQQAQSEMNAIAAQIAAADPARNKGNGARVQPLNEVAFEGLKQPLLLLQGAVAFVLLIGCANVAGLLLARAASRRTEVAIRSAIGAGRGRIVRQLLTESVVLAALGGVLGGFLAWGGLRLFIGAAPPGFPRLNELSLDAQVLAFTALVTVLTGFFFGVVPAVQASRPDLVDALKDSSRSASAGTARQRLRSGLVAVQIALALILLIGAGLMINSFVRIQNSQLGVDPHGLLTFEFRFPVSMMKRVSIFRGTGYWEISPVIGQTLDQILERMKTMPGVISAAGTSAPPLRGARSMDFLIDGRPAPPRTDAGAPGQSASYIAVTPNYFATLKVPILRGRDFNDRDNNAGPAVIIINESMAKRYWPNEDPMGKRITLDFLPDERPREIVAVVADTRLSRAQLQPGPILYVPFNQQTEHWRGPSLGDRSGLIFVLRAAGDPLNLVPGMRQAVAAVDRSRPVSNIRTVEQTLEQQVRYFRLYVLLLGVFGAIAAILAAIGIYGVMSYNVAQRTHEIGIRMALGATTHDVLRMVVRQALWLIAVGLALGLAGSLALTRLIESALWGVTARDPLTFAGVSVFLALVALIACVIPTRQAAGVDPTLALRSE
jgi:putative ABC transport system permease protein